MLHNLAEMKLIGYVNIYLAAFKDTIMHSRIQSKIHPYREFAINFYIYNSASVLGHKFYFTSYHGKELH